MDTRPFTCPMHPEVRQEGPGACPKCGMALEPMNPAPVVRTEYTCPMHPEIVQDAPGTCPKCGMALEPRTVPAGDGEENAEYEKCAGASSSVPCSPYLSSSSPCGR